MHHVQKLTGERVVGFEILHLGEHKGEVLPLKHLLPHEIEGSGRRPVLVDAAIRSEVPHTLGQGVTVDGDSQLGGQSPEQLEGAVALFGA